MHVCGWPERIVEPMLVGREPLTLRNLGQTIVPVVGGSLSMLSPIAVWAHTPAVAQFPTANICPLFWV